MRLTYREQNGATGNLEICFDNVWQAVDINTFDSQAIRVACTVLGYDVSEVVPSVSASPVQSTTQTRFVSLLNCTGNETRLNGCEVSGEAVNANVDLRVTCPG